MSPEPRNPRRTLALGVICLVAIGVRLIGLQFGLPAVYNQDEIAIMNRALAFATRDLNPHNFLYPTLYFYVLFAWEGLWFGLGWIFGVFPSIAAFQREFFVDPTRIYVAGRLLTVLCGTLTVWAVYRLGARLAGWMAGLAAGLFLAVAPFAVRDAHYVKHDVPVTVLIVATHVVLAGMLVERARWQATRAWILAGALAGLAMSTHYYAIVIVLPITAVALWPSDTTATWTARVRRLAIAGVSAAVAFAATSPFIFLEPRTFWRDVAGNREIVVDRAVAGAGLFASFPRYLSMLTTDAIGWPVFYLALAGAVFLLVKHWRAALLLLAFPLPFLLLVSNTVPATRYLNPILPSLAVLAAIAVVHAAAMFRRQAVRLTFAATLAAAAPGLVMSVNTGLFFRQTDTRTLALQYIEREITPGASILIQPYSVPIRRSRESLVEGLRAHGIAERDASVKFRNQLDLSPYPAPAYRTIYLGQGGQDVDLIYVDPASIDSTTGLAPLRALAIDYVVIKRSDVAAPLTSFDAALMREGRMLTTFSPFRTTAEADDIVGIRPFVHNADARITRGLERPGPIVEIWRITR